MQNFTSRWQYLEWFNYTHKSHIPKPTPQYSTNLFLSKQKWVEVKLYFLTPDGNEM